MSQPVSITLAALAARTVAGSGSVVDIEDALHRAAKLTVRATAVTSPLGAPILTLAVMTSDDESTWRQAAELIVNEVTAREVHVEGLSQYVRLDWTLADITSVTFSVTGEAHVVYCDAVDITNFAVPERAISEVSADRRIAACIAASDEADGYLATRYTFPLLAWPTNMREHCANIAAASLFRRRGVDPQSADAIVFDGRDQARSWFKQIANGLVKPPGIVDSTEEINEGGSVVESDTSRGW